MRTLLSLGWLAILVVAAADPNPDPNCSAPEGQVALGVVQIGNDASATFYVDDRNYPTGNGIWLYQESNGVFSPENEPIWNLQRGGECGIIPCDNADICGDSNPAGPDYQIRFG